MALGAYAEHFREKGDWAALADLLEFSFERARAGGHPRRGAAAPARGDRDRQREAARRRRARDRRLAAGGGDRADVRAGARGAEAAAAQEQELGPMAALLEREAAAQPDLGSRRRDPAPRRPDLPGEARQGRAGHRDLQGHPRAGPERRGVDARGGRDLRAGGRLRQPGAAAARADRPREHQAGAGRPAAPGTGDLRRADRRISSRASGRPTRSCRRSRAIATR